MEREVAGISARGLPLLWRQRLEAVSKTAEDPVEAGSLRVFRLPMGGWLCRFAAGSLLIDGAGADLAPWLWGGAGFQVLTQPMDMTRRNDQLLVRMYTADPPRHVFTHIAFHLPAVSMSVMPLVELGKSYGSPAGARIHTLGRAKADGSVPYSCSYRIEIPDGPCLLVVGPNLRADEAEAGGVDLAIVSPRNAELAAIVTKVAPALAIVDDAFVGPSHPTLPRVTLRDVFALQQALLPAPSVVLAPGESWTVQRKEKK